jgi:hypothetical protein
VDSRGGTEVEAQLRACDTHYALRSVSRLGSAPICHAIESTMTYQVNRC